MINKTLDRTVNLSKHIETIRTRGIEKLNVLRSLSYKNWSLGASQQLTVYKSLIRSCLEYAAPVTIVNQQNIERLSGVQYRALKIIAKERGNNCSSQFLHDLFQIQTLDARLHELAKNYFESAILNKNPAIIELMNNITHSSGRKLNPIEASLDFT